MTSLGSEKLLTSAHLANEMCLGGDDLASRILAEARGMLRVNFFSVELGDQDVEDGVKDRFRRALQQIRNSHQHSAFAQANRIVEIGKREELNFEFRQRSDRAEFTVSGLKKTDYGWIHSRSTKTTSPGRFAGQSWITPVYFLRSASSGFFLSASSGLELRYSRTMPELDLSASIAS
jgi:hypothetical protein